MKKTYFQKIITAVILLSLLLNSFSPLFKPAKATTNSDMVLPTYLEPSTEKKTTYQTLSALLPGWLQESIYYGFWSNTREFKMPGRDKARIKSLANDVESMESDGTSNIYIAQDEPNTNSIIFKKDYFLKNYIAKSALAISPDLIENKKEDVVDFDWRIVKVPQHLFNPKADTRQDPNFPNGEEQDYLRIRKWGQKDKLSKECLQAEQGDDQTPVSAHDKEGILGVQFSEMDYIKCTQIERDPETCRIKKKKPLKEIPIKFSYQTSSQSGALDPGNGLGAFQQQDFMKKISGTWHNLFKHISVITFLNQTIQNWLNLDNQYYKPDDLKHPQSGPNLIAEGGWALTKQEFALPPTFKLGHDFPNTIEEAGKAALFEVFNKVLPQESFVGPTFDDWLKNIGKETLSEKLFGANHYLNGGNSETILANIGRRKFENLLGLKQGILNKTAGDAEKLRILLGEGAIEEKLNLKLGSFAPNSLTEIEQLVGTEKYNLIFSSEPKMTANMLGIPYEDFENNRSNPLALKKIVGKQIIAQNIEIYQEYTIPDSDDKINSRDIAFNTENYLKPSINFAENKIITYKFTPNKGVETSEYPYDVDSRLYENLLKTLQENSIVRRFTEANDLNLVYKETGIDALAKSLSHIDDEREYLRQWFTSGDIPKNENGSLLIDTEKIGAQIGLKDRYDLARIFTQNRAYEVFKRFGRLQLELAMDPSAGEYLENYAADYTEDAAIEDEFLELKLKQIETEAKNLADPAKSDIINTYLSIARNASNDSKEDVVLNAQKRQISSSLFNIGHVLKFNNLQDSEPGQKINTIINEIISAKEFPSVKNLPHNVVSNLEIGLSQKELDDFLNQDETDINIDEFKQLLGKRVIAYLLDEENSSIKNINKAINSVYKNNNQPVSALYNELKPQMDETSEALNLSLNRENEEEKLTGWELAATLSGIQNYSITKIAAPTIALNLNIQANVFIDFLNGEASFVADDIDLSNILIGGDLYSDYESKIKDLIGSLGRFDFQSTITQKGQEFFLSLFQSLPYNDIPGIDAFYNSIGSSITDLFNGKQGRITFEPLRILEGFLGKHGFEAMYRRGPFEVLKEYGINSIDKFIREQLPGLTDNIDITRWLNGMGKAPEDIVTLIKDKFSDLLSEHTGGKYDDLINNLTNTVGMGEAAKEYAINYISSLAHLEDYGFDKNVINNLLNGGDVTQALSGYLQNIFAKEDIPFGSQITQLLNGDLKWDSLAQEAKNYFSNYVTDLLGKDLPPGIENTIIQAINGNMGPIDALLSGNWNEIAHAGFDKLLFGKDVIAGATSAINDLMGQLNGQIQNLTNLLNIPAMNLNLTDLLNTQNLINNLQGYISNTIGNITSGLMSSLTQNLGLPSGFLSGLLSGTIPNVFSFSINIFGNLTGSLLPNLFGGFGFGIGMFGGLFSGGIFAGAFGGLFGQKKEIWCAMDYYPYLDPEVIYDIAFEEKIGEEDLMGLEKWKERVGDNAGCITKVCPKGVVTECHGKGEFKLDSQQKLKAKLKEASKFKVTQLVGELLRIHELVAYGKLLRPKEIAPDKLEKDMLPRQIRVPLKENYAPFIGKLDRLYGTVRLENGVFITEKTAEQRTLDDETRSGVWHLKKYPFVYVSY